MSDTTLDTKPPADAAAIPGQRINGVLDVARATRVAGWAIDRADQDAAVVVTVYREGRRIGEVRADQYRPDLERGGIGTGRYGFGLDVDPPIEPGFEFTITATARATDGIVGSLRPVGRARPSEDVAHRLLERTFSELSLLRAQIDRLQQDSDGSTETWVEEALDRIEITQARLEHAMASAPPPPPIRPLRGLILAVGLALALGAASLSLGIWSMLTG